MRRKNTRDEFAEKANQVFNQVYDYSRFIYFDNKTKGIIVCPVHGEFLQRPKNHLNGQGCAKCSNNQKLDKQTFIIKANCIHQSKYNYSLVDYVNSATKIEIIGPVHGKFPQRPNNHLAGQGCPKCKGSKGERLIRSWLVKNKIEFDSQFTIFGCKNERSLLFDFAIFDQTKLVGLIEYDGEHEINDNSSKAKQQKMHHRDQIKKEYCKTHNIPLLVVSYEEVAKVNEFLKEFVANSHNF